MAVLASTAVRRGVALFLGGARGCSQPSFVHGACACAGGEDAAASLAAAHGAVDRAVRAAHAAHPSTRRPTTRHAALLGTSRTGQYANM